MISDKAKSYEYSRRYIRV